MLNLCFGFLEQRRFQPLVRFHLRGLFLVRIALCEENTPFLPITTLSCTRRPLQRSGLCAH